MQNETKFPKFAREFFKNVFPEIPDGLVPGWLQMF